MNESSINAIKKAEEDDLSSSEEELSFEVKQKQTINTVEEDNIRTYFRKLSYRIYKKLNSWFE